MEFRQLVKLSKLQKNKRFFDMDIEKLRLRLLNNYVLQLPRPDDQVNRTCSIIKGLRDYLKLRSRLDEDLSYLTELLLEKLMLSRNLLYIAIITQGFDIMRQIDLLAHYTFLAVNAECLRKAYWSVYFEQDLVFSEIHTEISRLQQKVKLDDPKFRATSSRVLKASKILPRSPLNFSPDKYEYLVEVFLDSLLFCLRQLLEVHSAVWVPVQDQILKLQEGVKFISVLLCVQQERFYALSSEMMDRIGAMIIDAGILSCSLRVNEMKDGLAKEMKLALSHFLKELQSVTEKVAHVHPLTSTQLSFPKTNELGSIDFLLKNLKDVASSNAGSSALPMNRIQSFQEELLHLRSFLEIIAEQRDQNEKLQAFWHRAMEVAYKAEVVIDSTLAGDEHEWCLDVVVGDIKILKTELAYEIYSGHNLKVVNNFIPMPSQVSSPIFNEHPVGLEDEVETIIGRLTRGTMHLDIVPVVGMPGLGKTTLASSVYCHQSVVSHFPIRAWCCVSRVYSKKSLLLQILCNESFEINEDDLATKLFRHLKRNRYVIILDDIWDIDAWDLLKNSLPDDSNGSRILFTSRSQDLFLHFTPHGRPHHLRPLSDVESWELLQKKIFHKEICPPQLSEVGFRIAKSCKGLPLAVVLIAGILANTKLDITIWEKFAQSLISNIAETEECMNTLEQSYRQLPEYLKPCLLYFGAFQEDQDIPVQRLLWLWISEGFVQRNEEKSLEDVAEDYLMELIGRSLVMVTKKRSMGGAKACRLHDLIHEFCQGKAKEESFLQIINRGNDLYTFAGLRPHRLCIYFTKAEELERSRIYSPRLRCLLLFFRYARWNHEKVRDGFWFMRLKLLRVLDILGILLVGNFPMELIFLVHLRYLAIHSLTKSIPSAIDNLSRLETFVVKGGADAVALPDTIWNIKTLRHLQVTGSRLLGFSLSIGNVEVSSQNLDHLNTLSLAIDCSSEQLQEILKRLPSLRRLKCVGLKFRGGISRVLKLDSLSRVESLKLHFFFWCKFEFPANLKKLVLSYNHQPWSEISTIGQLKNLEVLKLECNSFAGEKWEMQEGEFPNLRFLKLSLLDIRSWSASSDDLPCLEKLVVDRCKELEDVPSCLGESSTIEMIEVQYCSESLVSSVKKIQQEQIDMANLDLKVIIQTY